MPNTIAEYYTDELVDWNNAIVFYNNEMDEFEHKLAEVISRNSIIGIAEKAEAHQTLLNKVSKKEYIEIKFDCYNFLSGTLKKKKIDGKFIC